MKNYNFFVYIITNYNKTVLYIGVTNNLEERIKEHYSNRGKPESFAGRYNCFYLLYYERYEDIKVAIERETQLKGWRREKKDALIKEENPNFRFLNSELFEVWPPQGF
ncbi:MAG TPA: GIY-YIG nuclease family protein [Chitinophagales bacterium]|nr:GIY-YIG nuclease family protein [Chitinophagales bacterium]